MMLDASSASVSPLPASYRHGTTAMAIVGTLSITSSATLFLHITYKLSVLLWSRKALSRPGKPAGVDLSLGLSEIHYVQTKTGNLINGQTDHVNQSDNSETVVTVSNNQRSPNPLLILIYNLILADVGFSSAYMANFVWLGSDSISVGSPTCNAQGWLVSFGCIISTGFLFSLAIYTYLIVIRGWRPSLKLTIIQCILIWTMAVFVTCLGPIFSREEYYFSRQQFWCWINGSNSGWRLSVYVWGFLFTTATFAVYSYTFWALHRNRQSSRLMPSNASRTSSRIGGSGSRLRPSGHHPAFLIYPIIYLCCASPMLFGSLTPLQESTPFMTFAAIMLASSGFFNAILWAMTIVFSRREDIINTGLEHFTFMRTPQERTFGNMIWVQGAVQNQSPIKTSGGWWMLGRERSHSDSEIPLHNVKSKGLGPSTPGAIQLDISTTVVVEEHSRSNGTTEASGKSIEI
ncbi:hypothetical protein BX600DRAFT_452182 [Xylariales sp. PMI_506]|nr:hypothetical protein BX600DRAFT_452182 [Xylariales sp. PMI_506]